MSVEGKPRPLPDPFLVAATQNPIEYEGTYPLPEAQLDRFLFKLTVPLPSRDEEFGVLRAHHDGFDPRDLAAAGVRPVATAADLAAGPPRRAARCRSPTWCWRTSWTCAGPPGARPRWSWAPRRAAPPPLLNAAKANAWLLGRGLVTPDDVKAVARPALRHRIRVRHEAELEGATADAVLEALLATVPAPR